MVAYKFKYILLLTLDSRKTTWSLVFLMQTWSHKHITLPAFVKQWSKNQIKSMKNNSPLRTAKFTGLGAMNGTSHLPRVYLKDKLVHTSTHYASWSCHEYSRNPPSTSHKTSLTEWGNSLFRCLEILIHAQCLIISTWNDIATHSFSFHQSCDPKPKRLKTRLIDL